MLLILLLACSDSDDTSSPALRPTPIEQLDSAADDSGTITTDTGTITTDTGTITTDSGTTDTGPVECGYVSQPEYDFGNVPVGCAKEAGFMFYDRDCEEGRLLSYEVTYEGEAYSGSDTTLNLMAIAHFAPTEEDTYEGAQVWGVHDHDLSDDWVVDWTVEVEFEGNGYVWDEEAKGRPLDCEAEGLLLWP